MWADRQRHERVVLWVVLCDVPWNVDRCVELRDGRVGIQIFKDRVGAGTGFDSEYCCSGVANSVVGAAEPGVSITSTEGHVITTVRRCCGFGSITVSGLPLALTGVIVAIVGMGVLRRRTR